MKRRNSGNNGYIGVDQTVIPTTGRLTPNKLYNIEVREQAVYQSGNSATFIGEPNSILYQRPIEWPSLPSVTAGSQQICGLFAVYDNETNVCCLQIQGAYQVNWGDGTSNTYASNAIALKRYDQESYAGLTSSVFRNYKTALITITPQTGQNFTSINFSASVPNSGAAGPLSGISSYAAISTNNWLDIRMAGPSITTLTVSRWAGNSISSALLEQFEFVGSAQLTSFAFIDSKSLRRIVSFPSTANIQDWQSMFYGCRSLQEIPRSALDGLVNGRVNRAPYTFYYCSSLQSLPVDAIDFRNIITDSSGCDGFFQNCSSLRRAPKILNGGSCRYYGNIFAGCAALEEAPEIDTSSNTSFTQMFNGCNSLRKVQSAFAGSSGTAFNLMFAFCYNLTSLPTMNTRLGTTFQDFARDCHRLEYIPQYDFTSATTILRMFYGGGFQTGLKYIPDFLNSGNSLTNMNSAFFGCQSLIQAPGITTSNVTDITSLFQGCNSLKIIPNYNLSKATSTTTPFSTTGSFISVGLTGISFSVNFSNNVLGPTALNNIYTSLATVGASGSGARTLTVSGNWGFTASNRSIAQAKGWSVV
jgi:hypothetical protein